MFDVPRGRLYRAALGQGASVVEAHGGAPLPPTRLSVSRIADPALALIGTGFPFKNLDRIDEYQRQFAAVARGHQRHPPPRRGRTRPGGRGRRDASTGSGS